MLKKNTILKYIYPLSSFLILISLLIARFLWPSDSPEPYSDIWETISGLGNTELNPVGYIFFQIALTILGILILIITFYIHPQMLTLEKNQGQTKLGSFFLLLGGIGFVLTGLIPDGTIEIPGWDKFHELTSGLGAIGVLLAAFFYWLPTKNAKDKINQKYVKINIALWWIPLVLAGFAYGYAELVIKPRYDLGWYGPEWGEAGVSGFYSFSVWERILFAVIIIYMGILVLMVPKSTKIGNRKDEN
ncbi:MAG TPA: DUF998 domain-containing protein [Patescibacteria group bacterium]|nr:DUF998 domain-containing protein [Patescibacteria group bacterium]